MTRNFGLCLALMLLLCSCGAGPTTGTSHEAGSGPQTTGQPASQSRGKRHRERHRGAALPGESAATGKFDFYVLSLSWSPGFCATPSGRDDTMQCGPERHFAFVMHGLWPQYEKGGWPEDCSTEQADQSVLDGMLAIMPSPKLVTHEWQKHGTCSGLSAKDYFDDATEAFNSIKMPTQYQATNRQIVLGPDQLRDDFAAANPKLGQQGFAVLCSGNGRYLQEVRACLTEDLEGRACNAEVLRDECKSDRIVMRPSR